jgi:hypothetical protein
VRLLEPGQPVAEVRGRGQQALDQGGNASKNGFAAIFALAVGRDQARDGKTPVS